MTACLLLLFVSSDCARQFLYLTAIGWQIQSNIAMQVVRHTQLLPFWTWWMLSNVISAQLHLACAQVQPHFFWWVSLHLSQRALPRKRPHMYVACMLTSLRVLCYAALSLLLSTWYFASHLNICDACRLQEPRAKDMPCLVLGSWCISLQVSYMMLLLMMQPPRHLLLPCQL